jgi:hypothetical protein
MNKILITVSAGFATGLLISACAFSEPDPEHCARGRGQTVCAELFNGERPYCTTPTCNPSGENFHGCVAEEPSPECNYACGGDRNIVEDSSCDEISGDGDGDGDPNGDGDSTGDGEPTGDGDPMLCTDQGDCVDPGAPFCDLESGECVSCNFSDTPDDACAATGAGVPVCEQGVCVQCTDANADACGGVTPICDSGANTCVGCSDHEQCGGTACNFAAGNCFDPSSAVHVDGDAMNCPAADGTDDAPYCTISAALAASGAEALIILHERDGLVEYTETNSISKPVAIFAATDESPLMRAAGNNPALTVSGQGHLFLRGIQIQSGQSSGIRVNGGSAWIERSKIVNNTGGGIVVDGGGMLWLENSFVGGSIDDQKAIDITDGTATILYSTLAAGFATAAALVCEDGSNTTVRNSLLVARTDSDELICPNVTITNSALEMAVPGNTELGSMTDTSWFVDGGYAAGDFRLSGTHPEAINTAAVWQTGDPATDIDGTARPTTDGSPDFAGAHRIP